jgi:hypothetical protein
MADYILTTGDTAMFKPSFGAATVVVAPGTLSGTGRAKVGGKPACVKGDEANVIVPGCMYQTPQYSIPGVGTLSIDSLAGDQEAKKTKSGGKAVLLKGGDFNAKFQVMSPAMQPPPGLGPPIPDSTPSYSGNGSFVTTNVRAKGS